MNFAYLCCMSLNSVTMPSKLLPISTEHGEMGIQVILAQHHVVIYIMHDIIKLNGVFCFI